MMRNYSNSINGLYSRLRDCKQQCNRTYFLEEIVVAVSIPVHFQKAQISLKHFELNGVL